MKNDWNRYDVGDLNSATKKELQEAVRRAAKAANERLRTLERRGYTKGVYRYTMGNLGGDRKRFRESTKTMSVQQLRSEYKKLRSFISAKTSTLTGRTAVLYEKYKTAVERGYTGSLQDLNADLEKYFAKEYESLFSSDIIYQAITTGQTNAIDAVMANREKYARMAASGDTDATVRGAVLKDYLKARKT